MLGGAAVLLAGLGVVAARTARGRTPPFVDANGEPLPGAIAEERWITLGGARQYVLLRGRNRDAPLLVNVHGGPGMSERPFYRYYNAVLEDDFVVAYWDQRGAGKSFDRSLDPATMTIDRMSGDLTELIDLLLAEFGRSQVLLLGHSWGTLLSLEHIARRPETVAAYIGVAQVTHVLESERESFNWALARARELGDDKAAEGLSALGPPPWTGDQLLEQRNHLYRLGGFHADPPSPLRQFREFLATPEMGWADLLPMFQGMPWTMRRLWDENQTFNAFERHPSLDAPIHLMLGRHDHAVSPRLAEAWLDALEAPVKETVWYEDAGHMIPVEAAEVFNREVTRIARDHGLLGAGG